MSNLFTRIKNAIVTDFHQALDHKEQQNPIGLLNQYLRQSEQEVEKVRKLVERQYVLNEEFTREYRHAQKLVEKRKNQAEITEQAGETELHQFVIQELAQYEERVARLKVSLDRATQQLRELEQKYEGMKHKLKDMNIRRMELMGRENMARAHHRMNQVIETSSSSHNASSHFDEMENYFDRIEQEVNSSYHRNTIDDRIAQLENEMNKSEKKAVESIS